MTYYHLGAPGCLEAWSPVAGSGARRTVIGVVGVGALGTLIAAMIASAGYRVIAVDADPLVVETARRRGLTVYVDDGEVRARVEAYTPGEAPAGAADAVIVAVKSYRTREAAPVAARLSRGVVATVQNGLGNYEVLSEAAPGRVVQGVSTWGAWRREPGVSVLGGRGEVLLGPPPPGYEESHAALVEALGDAGLRPRVTREIWREVWRKVAVNAGINPVTALARRPNGAVLEEPLWSVASRAAVEAARVAEAEGHGFGGPEAALEALRRVAGATAGNYSSMLQDVLACRRTEVDAINGEVYRRGARAGLPVEVNMTLYHLVKGLEVREECRRRP